jgi:inactivated superfamily I helicase
MKYMVQVNRNMMISIEAETALRAEHKMLDYDGVAMAMAFDHDMMKTDTFRGALMSCDTVSLAELAELSGNYTKAWQAVGKAQDAMRIAQHEVERIEEELKLAKAAAAEAVITYNHNLSEAKRAKACMGLRDDD